MVCRFIVSVVAVIWSVAVLSSPALAAPARAPQVKVRASSAGSLVNIRISVSSRRKLSRPRINLFRGADEGPLMPYVEIQNPRGPVTLVDAVPEGIYAYRAQMIARIRTHGRKTRRVRSHSPVVAVYVEGQPESENPSPLPVQNPLEPPPPITLAEGVTRCPDYYALEVLSLVNSHRANAGLAPLALHSQLTWAAEKHSNMMVVTGLFTHDGWFEEILESGFQGSSFGQNIAAYFQTPQAVVDGWMSSDGHRANILKESYGHMGLSCLIGPSGRYWTQNFGS